MLLDYLESGLEWISCSQAASNNPYQTHNEPLAQHPLRYRVRIGRLKQSLMRDEANEANEATAAAPGEPFSRKCRCRHSEMQAKETISTTVIAFFDAEH